MHRLDRGRQWQQWKHLILDWRHLTPDRNHCHTYRNTSRMVGEMEVISSCSRTWDWNMILVIWLARFLWRGLSELDLKSSLKKPHFQLVMTCNGLMCKLVLLLNERFTDAFQTRRIQAQHFQTAWKAHMLRMLCKQLKGTLRRVRSASEGLVREASQVSRREDIDFPSNKSRVWDEQGTLAWILSMRICWIGLLGVLLLLLF